MKDHFSNFAGYNSWANTVLYDAVSALESSQREQDLLGFFKSITGTLNHILVGDLLWMERLEREGAKPATLDTILFTNFAELFESRKQIDQRLIQFVDRQTEDSLQNILDYKTTAGELCHEKVAEILSHLFNHQTHHRGQCHQMLSQLGKTPPSIDMIYYIRGRKL
ncbi:hypothetical protein A9Q83_18215 [Alphaproteobacteria bacterium 46_93_T64]|nr:hypothetical protein A9Q83_18215 [Alphaproteobacteria bacterium 46_93_T64]